jgi:hypothetical protein
VYVLFLGMCAGGRGSLLGAATGSLEDRLALATRVTDYVLNTKSRFGAAITDDPRTDGSRADAEAR